MSRATIHAVAWIAVTFLGQVHAEILPSFHFDVCAWKATDVVVIDLKGRVIECWKGELQPGDELPISTWNLVEDSEIHPPWWERVSGRSQGAPLGRVSGQRRTLFLVRDRGKPAEDSNAWEAASIWRDINSSVVWLENEKAFAIQQSMNPGPALMHSLSLTAKALRTEVARLAQQQKALRTAAKEADAQLRAKGMVRFLEEKNYLARKEALEVLKDCGDAAWPVVEPLLFDEKHLPLHADLIHLLDKVGGKNAVPAIEKIIVSEIDYWESLSQMEQQVGSYNPPMHYHYYKLSACLFVLKQSGYRDTKGIVLTLQQKWDANPVLSHLGGGGGPDGRSPILKSADKILANR